MSSGRRITGSRDFTSQPENTTSLAEIGIAFGLHFNSFNPKVRVDSCRCGVVYEWKKGSRQRLIRTREGVNTGAKQDETALKESEKQIQFTFGKRVTT